MLNKTFEIMMSDYELVVNADYGFSEKPKYIDGRMVSPPMDTWVEIQSITTVDNYPVITTPKNEGLIIEKLLEEILEMEASDKADYADYLYDLKRDERLLN